MLRLYHRSGIVVFKDGKLLSNDLEIGKIFERLVESELHEYTHNHVKEGQYLNLINKGYTTWDPANKTVTDILSISKFPTNKLTKWHIIQTGDNLNNIMCTCMDGWFGRLHENDALVAYAPNQSELKAITNSPSDVGEYLTKLIQTSEGFYTDVKNVTELTPDPYDPERFVKYEQDFYSLETASGYCLVNNFLAETHKKNMDTYWGMSLKFDNTGVCREHIPPTEGKLVPYKNKLYFEPLDGNSRKLTEDIYVSSDAYACRAMYKETLDLMEHRAQEVIRRITEARYEYDKTQIGDVSFW